MFNDISQTFKMIFLSKEEDIAAKMKYHGLRKMGYIILQ